MFLLFNWRKMLSGILMAAKIALPSNDISNKRNFWLGCVGIRVDGAVVSSQNGAVELTNTVSRHELIPNSHAEGRVLRKLGKGGVMYVARVSRLDGQLKMSRPCFICRVRIKAAKVEKVFYSIDNNHYGIWFVDEDYDKICEV
jgi:tRNA(Arg) A34 adenosine deaminase TadA